MWRLRDAEVQSPWGTTCTRRARDVASVAVEPDLCERDENKAGNATKLCRRRSIVKRRFRVTLLRDVSSRSNWKRSELDEGDFRCVDRRRHRRFRSSRNFLSFPPRIAAKLFRKRIWETASSSCRWSSLVRTSRRLGASKRDPEQARKEPTIDNNIWKINRNTNVQRSWLSQIYF